jgi:hypothetical protein
VQGGLPLNGIAYVFVTAGDVVRDKQSVWQGDTWLEVPRGPVRFEAQIEGEILASVAATDESEVVLRVPALGRLSLHWAADLAARSGVFLELERDGGAPAKRCPVTAGDGGGVELQGLIPGEYTVTLRAPAGDGSRHEIVLRRERVTVPEGASAKLDFE